MALVVAPGDVASAAVAGRAPRRPDDLCGPKAGWSSAMSSERPSGENENALRISCYGKASSLNACRASGRHTYLRPSEVLTRRLVGVPVPQQRQCSGRNSRADG